MYAIIKSGGKQYRVKEGDIIDVELLTGLKSNEVKFNDILMLNTGNSVKMGAGALKNATVKGELVENFKDKKLIIFKYKKRKNCKRKNGHRQNLSRVKITAIEGGK